MTNQLVEDNSRDDHLLLNYEDLLKTILAELNKTGELFKLSGDKRRLIVQIDTIAKAIAILNISSPILGREELTRTATINFSPEFAPKFNTYITDIKDTLSSLLKDYLATENFSLTELVTNLSQYKANQPELNFLYPFAPLNNIAQQSLVINPEATGSTSALKLHKLTIQVKNLQRFTNSLRQGLENYVEDLTDDEEELEDIQAILAEGKDIDYLREFVNQETLGQLKKEACLKYLEYIAENISEYNHDIFYLKDLIRRLKLLKEFFNQDHADNYYKISYEGQEIDLKTALAQSYAFDCLPIIPIVTGNLGEISGDNQDNPEFVFGLKLKLNSPVEKTKSKSALAYHLDFINPNSQLYKEELAKATKKERFYTKVFQRFCVYFFVLTSRCQPDSKNYHQADELNYDPVESFNSKCFGILKGSDDQAKKDLLINFNKGLKDSRFKIEHKLAKLAKLLKEFLTQGTILKPQEYPVHIEIQRGILESECEDIITNQTLLKNKRQPKKDLSQVVVSEAAINPSAFCQIEAKLTIEDIRYHLQGEKQLFNMEYDLEGIQTLPILFSPKHEIVREKYQSFSNQKLVNFPYSLDIKTYNSTQQFRYYFTFSLLTYICLKIITDEIKLKLFLPILRLHLQGKDNNADTHNPESEMRDYSKVLAHLLSMDHLANSQGIDIKKGNKFKTKNALNSLYSVIPKNFSFPSTQYTPTLDKVALIIVSSHECDGSKQASRDSRLSNLIGEVITMDLLPSGKVQVKTLKSLSANYVNEIMYRQPTIILDTVTNLYHQGYRHIFYVAKTPYTSNLHLTKSDNNDNLFFLSRDLIKYIYQDYQDLYLYPVFFEQYYVRKVKGDLTQSLSLQDSRQLQDLFNDPTQKGVIFFNLFNGITVKEDSFYNGVISYSTLVGVYKDLLDDQAIRQNLVYNEGQKNDLLQYLTLLHFSRYEKSSSQKSPHSLKLNPYQDIVSDQSVSKLSLFKHPQNKTDFNLLAFLTEVRRVLTVTPQPENHESN